MDPIGYHKLLEKHIPLAAVSYCFKLWVDRPFEFKLRNKRLSKVGDFTCHQGKSPRITINSDSHPYLFLLTYVHEVAHLVVHQECGWKVAAHGVEWKETFRQLMAPLMKEEIFPHPLFNALKKHLLSPKASSFSDSILTHALRQYDDTLKTTTLLSDIPEGSTFCFHGKWFKKGSLKRTRVVCRELKTKGNYLVPVDAEIEAGSQPMLF